MNLIKDRIFLAVVACILFIYIAFFLFQVDRTSVPPPGRFFCLTSAYLIFLNAVIAAAWFAFGWFGGAVFLALSIIAALSLLLAARSPFYYIHIALFLTATFFSFRSLMAFVLFQTDYLLEREKVEEDRNMLSEKLKRDKAQAEALKLKFRRYHLLKDVTEHLSNLFSQDKITSFLGRKSYEIIGKSARSLVYLVNLDTQELVLTHSKQPYGLPRIKTKKGDIFDKWVLKQNQPLIVLDAAKDFRFPQDDILSDEVSFKSLIAAPMVSHNKMIGLLRLDSQQKNAYNPDDLRLLGIISDLGAVSLHNNMLYQRTTELAIRDGLTNLFVHRYFMERLTEELQRALTKKHGLSILMIDLDHFKNYNDKYGHIAGDILLKRLSGIFISVVGTGDIVARYGGEEFSIILFAQNKRASKDIAEKIRMKIEKEIFYLRREKTHVTVSIGISVFPDDARMAEDLLKAADKNLYQAKKEGRNKVCMN